MTTITRTSMLYLKIGVKVKNPRKILSCTASRDLQKIITRTSKLYPKVIMKMKNLLRTASQDPQTFPQTSRTSQRLSQSGQRLGQRLH
jgi:hypothetical protein